MVIGPAGQLAVSCIIIIIIIISAHCWQRIKISRCYQIIKHDQRIFTMQETHSIHKFFSRVFSRPANSTPSFCDHAFSAPAHKPTARLHLLSIHIWWNDVTESMVTTRSTLCWYNLAKCVELMDEDLPRYSDKIQPLSLRECPHGH